MTEIGYMTDLLREAAIGLVGSALLAAVVGLLVAGCYRWVTTRSPPAGTPVVVGLSMVAAYLTYRVFRSGKLVADVPLDHQSSAGYLLATFLIAGLVATAGGRLGDRIACQVTGLPRIDSSDRATALVRSGRLATDIELPETIEDADGYRPVTPSVRRTLAGATIRLPHGLSSADRRDRIERQLESDYDVGYANVTMDEGGTINRVVVGRRSTGLGSMLPPNTVAIAITADPSPDASLGDPVEIWSTQERSRLVTTGTLRTTSGSVATVIVDAENVPALSTDRRYRLVTRPDEPTDSYEFASTLRTVEETVVAMTVQPDGPVAGEFAGWLPGRVLVIDRDGEVLSLPADNETLREGDRLWLLASPADLDAIDSDGHETRPQAEPPRTDGARRTDADSHTQPR